MIRIAAAWLCLSLPWPQVPPREAQAAPPRPRGAQSALEVDRIDLAEMIARPRSEMAEAVERWSLDQSRLRRLHGIDDSPTLRARLRRFHAAWAAELGRVEWDALSRPARVDSLALRTWIRRAQGDLERAEALESRLLPFIGVAEPIWKLCEAQVRLERVQAEAAADALDGIARQFEALRVTLHERRAAAESSPESRFDALRAAKRVDGLARALEEWFQFHDGYDPEFSWWCRAPYAEAQAALRAHAEYLRESWVGAGEGADDIVGDPIGSEALAAALRAEWIPYSAAELLDIAEREFRWCEGEMRAASREMGLGDDWKAALDRVKGRGVPPGEQPTLIRDMTLEAIAFLRERELLHVPPLAAETWRMEMLSPQAQRLNPFFLGGEAIQVAYPTDTMSHADKRMSLRGNNRHFARAVVHHEVIPGHNLQGFVGERVNRHREVFQTPFWTEGWALYWELILYEKGFAKSPEDRVGMLFWRMHRCARIVFSLRFHLGELSPRECIDLLVDRVGHERANAEAEVRRSFEGGYGPLYQAGYLLGGMQLRALRRERVESGRWSEQRFHDAVLEAGSLPIELVRALLDDEGLNRDRETRWRFAD